MEKKKELYEVLGEDNFYVLIDEVRNGNIKKDHLKLMSLEMGGPVHGVFEDKCEREKVELEHVLRLVPH